ncbi:MAG: AraC family transcriptional regulator [Paenibacillus sp.]|jgi:AraC-like DNA-binding protein|nr:AraC family transcriptional regulator [Paenibacillus sp.]
MAQLGGSIELGRLPDVRITFQLMGLHVEKVDSHWTYPSHEHPMYEIHWIVDGEMQMVVDGQIHHKQKGDLLFIHPGVTHSCISAGPQGFTYFCVHFSVFDLTFSKELDRHKTTFYPAASPLVKGMSPSLSALRALAVENRNSTLSASKNMKVYAAMFELIGVLVEQLSHSGSTPFTRKELLAGRIAEQIDNSVRGVLHHGENHENERTWLHSIAKSLKMSTSQVNRIFRQIYGKAPRRYMSEILLNEAKRLLTQTDLPIDHIAMMLGYKTCAHFSRQFKRWTHIPPSEYRKTPNSAAPADAH